MKYNITIILNDGTSIKTQDSFDVEEDAINQCQQYATSGYYSRTTRKYWTPTCIHHMSIDTE